MIWADPYLLVQGGKVSGENLTAGEQGQNGCKYVLDQASIKSWKNVNILIKKTKYSGNPLLNYLISL